MFDSFNMKIGNPTTNLLIDYVEELVNNAERVKFKDLISEKFPEGKKGEIEALAFGRYKEKDTHDRVLKVFTGRIKRYSLDIFYNPYIKKSVDNILPINTSKLKPEIKRYNSLNGSRKIYISVEYLLKKASYQFLKKEGLSNVLVWLDNRPRENLEDVLGSDAIILNKKNVKELENILKNNKKYLGLARDMEWL